MKCILMPSSFPPIILVRTVVLVVLLQNVGVKSQPNYGPSHPVPPIVRHPGTCTFQRSQPACTFSLLCYLAGGIPIEGCGGDISTTCCMLYNAPHAHPHPHPHPHSHPLSPNPHHPHHPPPLQHPAPPPHHSLSPPPPPPQLPPPPSSHHYGPSQTGPHYDLDNTVRRTVPALAITPQYPQREHYARNFVGEDVCGKPSAKPTNRIIGGQDAYFGEFPWQVHIKIAKHQCGGALVNREFVVTAAHCVYQAPLHQLSIIIGAHDIEDHRYQDQPPQYFNVAEVRLHPNFRFSASHPDRYDVAVLRLDKAARYNDNVLPVCLPPKGFDFEGWHGFVTGWGKTDPALSNRYGTRLLQKVDVPVIKNTECETWHQTRGIDLKIFPEMICAGYEDGQKDACVGDSGGPLVVFLNNRWTLAGITSAGFGCAQSRQPGIYHRLSVTVDWVLNNVA